MLEKTTPCYDDVTRRLGETKQRLVRVQLAESVAWVLGAFILTAALVLTVDHLLTLPPVGRIVLGGLGVVGLVIVVVWRGLVPLVRAVRLSTHQLSLVLEQHFPELESRIVTVTDLHSQLQAPVNEVRRGFLGLAILSAHQDTVSTRFCDAVSTRRMAQLSSCAGVLVVASIVFAIVNPDGLLSALRRFTGIFHEMRLAQAEVVLNVRIIETKDKVHRLRGARDFDAAAIRGSTAEVLVWGSTTVEAPVSMHVRVIGADEFSTGELPFPTSTVRALENDLTGEQELCEALKQAAARGTVWRAAKARLANVRKDTELYFSLGAVRTRVHKVRATGYPKIENVQLRLVFPDYTRVRPQFIPATDGRIRALYKTKAEVTVRSDKPLRKGSLEIDGQRRAAKAYGRRASTSFTVVKDGTYSIEIVDEDGFRYEREFKDAIECLEDQDPTIEVYSQTELTLGASSVKGVAIRFRAQDDYGIDKVRLVYQIGHLPGIRPSKERAREPRSREEKLEPKRTVSKVFPCHFDELGLEIGELVKYHLEVDDTDTIRGPHTAKSETMTLVIIGRELQDWIELEDEDRWPTDFVGFEGSKRASGLGRPGVSALVTDAGEKPNESSPGVTNLVEGYVPHQLRNTFADYSNALNERK